MLWFGAADASRSHMVRPCVAIDLQVCGLASIYPASDWSSWSSCSRPSWTSARVRSHYRTGLKRGHSGRQCSHALLNIRARATFELLRSRIKRQRKATWTERPFIAKRVQIPSPEWEAASSVIRRAMRLTAELNKLSFDDVAKVREIFSELTGRKVDDTFILIPPSIQLTAWISELDTGYSLTSAARFMIWLVLTSPITS